jgi:hypothetical protein
VSDSSSNHYVLHCRHYHAHAAIVCRTPSRFKDNVDCLKYLIEKQLLLA